MEPSVDRYGRYGVFTQRLLDSVMATPGQTPSELRRAVLERAKGAPDGVPASFTLYVDKVARHAYKVTDGDVEALQRAGNSDDALFEITVSAALGAALGRLERGLAALRGASPADPLEASPPDPLSTSWRGGTQEAS
jgi:hypothetical protein